MLSFQGNCTLYQIIIRMQVKFIFLQVKFCESRNSSGQPYIHWPEIRSLLTNLVDSDLKNSKKWCQVLKKKTRNVKLKIVKPFLFRIVKMLLLRQRRPE